VFKLKTDNQDFVRHCSPTNAGPSKTDGDDGDDGDGPLPWNYRALREPERYFAADRGRSEPRLVVAAPNALSGSASSSQFRTGEDSEQKVTNSDERLELGCRTVHCLTHLSCFSPGFQADLVGSFVIDTSTRAFSWSIGNFNPPCC
jgi:hypothetical protein